MAGHIRDWYRTPGGWAIWAQHDRLDGKAWPAFGAFLYEQETIRERHDDALPQD